MDEILESELDKSLRILIKILNAVEYIKLVMQNTKAPRIDDHAI